MCLQKSSSGEQSFSDIIKYPYEDLIKRDDALPEGIDTLHKEVGSLGVINVNFNWFYYKYFMFIIAKNKKM